MGQFLGRQARAARSQTIGEMNIVWSPEAIEDLASLRAYIAEDNPAAARRTVYSPLPKSRSPLIFF